MGSRGDLGQQKVSSTAQVIRLRFSYVHHLPTSCLEGNPKLKIKPCLPFSALKTPARP